MTDTLLSKISSPKFLMAAWGKLDKHNKSSHGLSGISIELFSENLEDKISSISKQLRNRTFRFSKNRAVLIPKAKGKFRPLQVPEIADRLVLKAIAIEMEEQFKTTIEQSHGLSFAYQKKLGIRDAISCIKHHYDNDNKYVLEADLINFFGEVNKSQLLSKQIFPGLPDDSLNGLITSALNQEIGGLEKIPEENRRYFDDLKHGIPQGNPLSPLLSNIFLSPFDLHLKSKGLNLVRYADDFVVMCKSEEECIEAYHQCKHILEKLALKIHPIEDNTKTNIVNLNTSEFSFLSITFNGTSFYPSLKNVERFKNKIRDLCHGKIEHDVLTLLKKISNILDGWISAYFYTEVEKYSEPLDYFINRQLYLALRRYDWKLSSGSIGKLPSKYRQTNESGDCLSDTQRKKSGIQFCMDLVNQKRTQDKKQVQNNQNTSDENFVENNTKAKKGQ